MRGLADGVWRRVMALGAVAATALALAACTAPAKLPRKPAAAAAVSPKPARTPSTIDAIGAIDAIGGASSTGDTTDTSTGDSLESGIASWYGNKFHGRRTASGERFDQYDFTAAHRTLPFGTRVLVRNPANGREVLVRINDRGPHIRGRVIDVSRAAAQALGFHGLTFVELQRLAD